jgi:hypothetical protein
VGQENAAAYQMATLRRELAAFEAELDQGFAAMHAQFDEMERKATSIEGSLEELRSAQQRFSHATARLQELVEERVCEL